MNETNLFCASSDGSVRLYHVQKAVGAQDAAMHLKMEWQALHYGR